MKATSRKLEDLVSVGPATLRDFELLGIRTVAQLAKQEPRALYRKLGRIARRHQDVCVLDVIYSAVAQARNPRLPATQCQWWWWSGRRRRAAASQARRESRR